MSASVDVATGNLDISASLLNLTGVNGQVPIGLSFNSRDGQAGTPSLSALKGPATGWTWSLAAAGSLSLSPNGTTIVYTAADGAAWPFVLNGSAYTSPAGFKAVLVKLSDGTYRLRLLESQQQILFNASGTPTSVLDRNLNGTAIAQPSANTATVQTNAGPSTARVATLTYGPTTRNGAQVNGTVIAQNSSGGSRTAFVEQDSSGNPVAVVDPTGARTEFTYTSGLVTQIKNPLGATISVIYDTSNRVTRITRSNTTSGAAGTSVTRFTYASSTSTYVAAPNTDQTVGVGSVPHATYTFDSNKLVTNAVDAAGRTRSTTYTTQGLDTATSTTGAPGGSPATVTSTYAHDAAVNGGLSLTGAASQGGNASTATYGNTTSTSTYSPSATATDTNTSTSNSSSYTYNGSGNPLTTTGNTTAGSTASGTAVTSTVTRNTDGTVATATAPGNGSNSTTYSYTNHLLTQVTPVTGSSLGVKTYSYDSYGRLKTVADGAGRTTTYGYDDDDRLLTTAFSDSTPTVTNTFDTAGELTQQASGGGTITNTYDQLGQLLTTANTQAGGTITYGYDKSGNNTSLTDTRGTTTQTFDAAGVLTSTTYPKTGGDNGMATTWYRTDSNGNRTDTYLQSNSTQSEFAAHTRTSFDASGRISRVFAEKGPAASAATQMDVRYCYNSAGSGTNCSTTSSSDYSKLQWTYNVLTSQTTRFTYDGLGRLTQVAESGGNNGNSTYTYTYDPRGNRLTANVTGTKTSSQTLTYNAANQITTSGYSYDGAGNLTASPTGSYTYNAAEQMTSATAGGQTYTYSYSGAAQNAVLSQTGNGHTYNIVYGRPDQIGNPTIAQYQVDGKTAYVEQDPNTGQATMLHTSSGIQALYVYDGLGSPVALLTDFNTTSFQYSYDPYGLPTLQADSGGNGVGQNPYTFKSGIQDRATGFVKYGARWYNPTTGTWTQQDTLDSPLDPANANRYAFASGDPVNNSDPSGAKSILGIAKCSAQIAAGLGLGVAVVAGIVSAAVADVGTGGAATVFTIAEAEESAALIAVSVYVTGSGVRNCQKKGD